MNRDHLRKVEILNNKRINEKPKVLCEGYFHQISNKVFLDGSIPVAVIEFEDGTVGLVNLYDIRFIS